MTWTRLSDTLNSDPRYLRLSDAAFRLHVGALVWCNQQLTDGLVPALALRTLTMHPHPDGLVDELVRVGLWAPLDLPGEDSWQVDWSDQLQAEEVRDGRARNAERQRRFRERRSRHENDDHTMCDRRFCPALKDTRNALRNASRNGNSDGYVTPPRPVPSPNRDRERDGAALDGAAAPPPEDPGPLCVHCSLTEAACRAVNGARPEGKPNRHEYAPKPSQLDGETGSEPVSLAAVVVAEIPEPDALSEAVDLANTSTRLDQTAEERRAAMGNRLERDHGAFPKSRRRSG